MKKYKTVQFTVEGKPQGKERPRFTKRRNKTKCYTPQKTVEYEELVQWEYVRQCKSHYFGDNTPLRMTITIYYPIPTKVSKIDKIDMIGMKVRPTKKPDIDNVVKIICDSLNGLAYRDDAQIVWVVAGKYYSDNPRVDIEISEKVN